MSGAEHVDVIGHVDVVENRWVAGYQLLVARVQANGAIVNPGSTLEGDARVAVAMVQAMPWPFDLAAFSARYGAGSYVMTTAVHSGEDCPFNTTPSLPMRSYTVHEYGTAPTQPDPQTGPTTLIGDAESLPP
jgi:hypothetical protein